MNIFYLDPNPRICATYYVDRHVVKMILESAQILCTVLNEKAGKQVTPYKSTHVNHPCVKWAGETYQNWSYVWNLLFELEREWNYRYKHTKSHKSLDLLCADDFMVTIAERLLVSSTITPPALAMPDYCKTSNPVESYRNYYNMEKRHLFKWTNRNVPEWVIL